MKTKGAIQLGFCVPRSKIMNHCLIHVSNSNSFPTTAWGWCCHQVFFAVTSFPGFTISVFSESPRNTVGLMSGHHSVADIMATTGLTRGDVRYWARKAQDPSFHSGRWGGGRRYCTTLGQSLLREGVLLALIDSHPSATKSGLARLMRQYGCHGSNGSWVKRTVKGWQYRHKRLYHIQPLKFTELNMLRYLDHIYGIVQVDPSRVKYLDESRFESRSNSFCFNLRPL